VIVTNHSDSANLHYDSEEMGGDVGTVGIVVEVSPQQLFATIRAKEAGLDRYLRDSDSFSLRTISASVTVAVGEAANSSRVIVRPNAR